MKNKILEILPRVHNPAQYIGNETNVSEKEFSKKKITFAIGYPDIYEIGMSCLGIRILYGLLNEIDNVVCERFFAPEQDMEDLLRQEKLPLFSLESTTPLNLFDFVGFSISSELNYTNFLNMLQLSEIPVLSKKRTEKHPIVIVGGSCAFNPLPLTPFADMFVIGEGEEIIQEIIQVFSGLKGQGRTKILEQLANIRGVFIPDITKCPVRKGIVSDFENSFFPVKWIVPFTEITHDRISLEIMRGCKQGCSFCQAGKCWRPVRTRSAKKILELAKLSYEYSGYEEISLLSFSSGDHPDISNIIDCLAHEFKNKHVAFSFPSLRIDTFSFTLANKIRTMRKTGLTFAPETSERLRLNMGKTIRDAELISLATQAKTSGWRHIKLYFMIGLPGETEQDLHDINKLIHEISRIIRVNVSFNTFIPKPHTILEREPFITHEEFEEKKQFFYDKLGKSKYAKLYFHPYRMSRIEASLGRGDKYTGNVLYRVWKNGARMENWKEMFDFQKWETAFGKEDIPMNNTFTNKETATLPWKFIRL